MAGAMIGIILGVLGLYSIIKGKLPFIRKYNGVKNIKLHSRIEGTAVLLVGIMIAFQCVIPINKQKMKNIGHLYTSYRW